MTSDDDRDVNRARFARNAKRTTRPGGQPGGSHAVRGWMKRSCWSENRSFGQSVIAGADPADIVAVSVELAHPAAATIAVIVVAGLVGGDGAANHRRADHAGGDAEAQAKTLGFRLGSGGCDGAGN